MTIDEELGILRHALSLLGNGEWQHRWAPEPHSETLNTLGSAVARGTTRYYPPRKNPQARMQAMFAHVMRGLGDILPAHVELGPWTNEVDRSKADILNLVQARINHLEEYA